MDLNLSVMVVAGLLTGTSFLENFDGRPESDPSGGPVATPAVAASTRLETAVERRGGRCKETEPTSSDIRIGSEEEPGERLILQGRVLSSDRRPQAGVKVYVFHADAAGYYSENKGMDNTHPRLCGVLRTDEMGRYRISTIKPARYAQGGPAAHVHYEVLPTGKQPESFVLTFNAAAQGGGAKGAQTWDETRPLERDARGVWHCTRDLWVR